jgi:hypothetical protein
MKSFEDLWSLNPNGTLEETRYNAENIVKTYGVSYDDLYWKYKEYLNYWTVKYGDKDPKYLRKSDELKSISEFLQLGMRNQTFTLPKTSRDYYYFGDVPQKDYEENLVIFKKLISSNE